jgi:phage N-6-adenine-methyltransferase
MVAYKAVGEGRGMNKKIQKVMFSSQKDDWETPQELFDELNAKYGPFDLDICASDHNKKCSAYFDKEMNGLTLEWVTTSTFFHDHEFSYGGMASIETHPAKCWMNPPYGREIGKWVKKAYEESQSGALVVCLLPSRTCTSWFHDYIYNKPGVEVHFIRGRIRFVGAKFLAPFPSMVVVFHPPKEAK